MSLLPRIWPYILLLAVTTVCGSAQNKSRQSPQIDASLKWIEKNNSWTLRQQVELCEIPAPPFKEQQRAAEFLKRLRDIGFGSARIDAEGNVIAGIAGVRPDPLVVLSAHLDTVFPPGTDVKVKSEDGRLDGPGISDDCRGLAVLLAVAKALKLHRVALKGTLWLVATVGEEGEGDLRGVRHLFGQGRKKEPMPKPDFFLSVDGAGESVTMGAVGSHRYRVVFKGPGGHSYGAFGMPNPMHAMGRAIALISDLQVPSSPRTTFNVGATRGGTSVNSIPFEASFDIDMRSESPAELERLVEKFRSAVQRGLNDEQARWPNSSVKLTSEMLTLGIRPAGAQSRDSRIVQAAIAAAKSAGFEPNVRNFGSTDSNIPISLGIPAVTITGGGRSGGAHSLGEWYEDGGYGFRGPQWAFLLTIGLTGVTD